MLDLLLYSPDLTPKDLDNWQESIYLPHIEICHHSVFGENVKAARELLVCFEATLKKLTLPWMSMSWCVVLKINKVPYLYAEQMCSKGLAFHRTVELR